VVRYTATALDVAGNASGDQLDLPASLAFTTANGPTTPITAQASADLVEPRLEIAKTVTRTVGDSGSLNGLVAPGLPGQGTAGDIFTYTLTLRQMPGATGPAHDISVSDALPAGLQIVPGSLVSTIPGVVLVGTATTVSATAALIQPGETFTISYQARILDSTGYDTDLPNRADLTFDSLPGPGGRVGADSDTAGVRLVGNGTVVKTVIATSNPNSGSGAFEPGVTDLTIGEEVTMRLTATLAEGTTRVVITDRLPTGPTGVLALVAFSAPVLGANVVAEFPNPTPTLTDSDGDGLVDSLRFDFGQVTVLGDNVIDARDTISIEVTARVPDDPRNSSGNRLNAPVLLDFGTGTVNASVPLDIVEPLLVAEKTALTPDRFLGQIASYEIRIFHAPNSVVAADVVVIDTLSPGLILVPGSLIVVSSPPGVSVTVDATTVSLPLLPLGTELVIRFDAQIAFTVDPTVPLTNTVTASWDQVPGAGGRPGTTEDTAVIGILPGDIEREEEKAGRFLDERYVDRLPRIDAIYSGTATPGARLVLSLADDLGAPAGTVAVTADAGGNWMALLPLARMSAGSDIESGLAGSSLFSDRIGLSFQSALWDDARDVQIGAFVADSAHSLRIDSLSAGHVQPDDLLAGEPELNLRTYFAPAWRDIPEVGAAPAIGRVYEELAANVVANQYEAARTPIGFGVNRFNAELLATGVGGR
jgi:large repetitive protein